MQAASPRASSFDSFGCFAANVLVSSMAEQLQFQRDPQSSRGVPHHGQRTKSLQDLDQAADRSQGEGKSNDVLPTEGPETEESKHQESEEMFDLVAEQSDRFATGASVPQSKANSPAKKLIRSARRPSLLR